MECSLHTWIFVAFIGAALAQGEPVTADDFGITGRRESECLEAFEIRGFSFRGGRKAAGIKDPVWSAIEEIMKGVMAAGSSGAVQMNVSPDYSSNPEWHNIITQA